MSLHIAVVGEAMAKGVFSVWVLLRTAALQNRGGGGQLEKAVGSRLWFVGLRFIGPAVELPVVTTREQGPDAGATRADVSGAGVGR